MLTHQQIIDQSKNAWKQWGMQWQIQAKYHADKFPDDVKRDLKDFQNIGVGKACLLIANGYSFEKEIETIKKYQKNVDILCCDKTVGHCLRNGITPTYVLVCDANVSYEKYLEPYKDQLQDTILLQNVVANPKWAENGNWKARYFFLVKDVIDSDKIIGKISGCSNVVAAGTNVSNAMLIFMTQCDNGSPRNFFGYDKYLLIGFDYSWVPEGKYYAFDQDGKGKWNYMRHVYGRNMEGKPCYSSNNLVFSMKWLDQYVKVFKLPVVQCSKLGIYEAVKRGVLSEQMQYSYRQEDSATVRALVAQRDELTKKLNELNSSLVDIGREHHFQFLGTA